VKSIPQSIFMISGRLTRPEYWTAAHEYHGQRRAAKLHGTMMAYCCWHHSIMFNTTFPTSTCEQTTIMHRSNIAATVIQDFTRFRYVTSHLLLRSQCSYHSNCITSPILVSQGRLERNKLRPSPKHSPIDPCWTATN